MPGELDRVERLAGFLVDEVGLRGNAEDYYDPRNSLLNEVLDRGLGIPITLALVYMEVGRRAGVPLDGVGLPRPLPAAPLAPPALLFDPFDGGRLLTEEDCRAMLDRLSGGTLAFDPRLLKPASPRHILIRMLNNLRRIYLHRGEFLRTIGALDRVLLLDPDDVGARRDRGLLSLRWGDPARGIEDLERYLVLEPEAPDHAAIEGLILEAGQRPCTDALLTSSAARRTPAPTPPASRRRSSPGRGRRPAPGSRGSRMLRRWPGLCIQVSITSST